MKFLIIFLLTFSVFAKSPQLRRIDERIKDLKTLVAECDGYGSNEAACITDFNNRVKRKIGKLNKARINEKDNVAINRFNKMYNEEVKVKDLRKFLDDVSVTYSEDDNSKALKALKRTYLKAQAELNCIADRQNFITTNCDGVLTFNGSETCDELNFALAGVNNCPAEL